MADVDASVLLDFVSSLAVLGLLVVCFSAVAPTLRHSRFSDLFLGVFFALVAGLQMSMPLSPADGVIIDMRNVPIVLAGAFLGLRGALLCLGMAAAMRYGIGGIGLLAGVLGMAIAAMTGYGWSLVQHRITGFAGPKLVMLGLAVNLHMLSAFAVPADVTQWYFAEAAPAVFLLNTLCVPAIGWLMLRDHNSASRAALLAASAPVDPVTRLLSLDAFAQEISHFTASDRDRHVAGIVAITLKNADWLAKTWGDRAKRQAMAVLRVRVAELFPDTRPLGVDKNQRLLVPMTRREMQDLRPVRKALRRLATETPLSLDTDVEVPLSVMVESFSVRQPDKPAETLRDINSAAVARRASAGGASQSQPSGAITQSDSKNMSLPRGVCQATFRRLFDETDLQLQRLGRKS